MKDTLFFVFLIVVAMMIISALAVFVYNQDSSNEKVKIAECQEMGGTVMLNHENYYDGCMLIP